MGYKIQNEEVKKISMLNLSGDIIPLSWYKHIRFKKSQKPNMAAISILARTIYWYKWSEDIDETSNMTIYFQKFKADMLQKSYNDFCNVFGFGKTQVKDAINLLVELGLMHKEFRNFTSEKGNKLYNVMYIQPITENIKNITYNTDSIYSAKNKKPKNKSENKIETKTENKMSLSNKIRVEFLKKLNENITIKQAVDLSEFNNIKNEMLKGKVLNEELILKSIDIYKENNNYKKDKKYVKIKKIEQILINWHKENIFDIENLKRLIIEKQKNKFKVCKKPKEKCSNCSEKKDKKCEISKLYSFYIKTNIGTKHLDMDEDLKEILDKALRNFSTNQLRVVLIKMIDSNWYQNCEDKPNIKYLYRKNEIIKKWLDDYKQKENKTKKMKEKKEENNEKTTKQKGSEKIKLTIDDI